MKTEWVPQVGEQVMIKSTGQVFEVTRVDYGNHHQQWMVRILDNLVPRWYFVSEVKKP